MTWFDFAHHRRFLALSVLALLLAGCRGAVEKPTILFIGVGSGTLATEASAVQFRDRFSPQEHNILGVVALEKPSDGVSVQATWFSPDDRRMPLARRTIEMASGATVARFSFANSVDWESAPYMLQVITRAGEGEEAKTDSGSVRYYIGMEDSEIAAYLKEFEE
jgi:hypothetical protein